MSRVKNVVYQTKTRICTGKISYVVEVSLKQILGIIFRLFGFKLFGLILGYLEGARRYIRYEQQPCSIRFCEFVVI